MHSLHHVGGTWSFPHWGIRVPVFGSHTRLEGYTSHIHLHLILSREYLSIPKRFTRIARTIVVEGRAPSLRMQVMDRALSILP